MTQKLIKDVVTVISKRFSCRSYQAEPISNDKQKIVVDFIDSLTPGPFGNKPKFHLVAANKEDRNSLKDLGTYGFIKDPTGFIIGSINDGIKSQEDYGYQMEQIILLATSIDLGTCWLGGSFTRSSFARKINCPNGENIPAVTAIGEIKDRQQARNGLIRRQVGADQRLDWNQLFFNGTFSQSLDKKDAGEWEPVLEMVRIGPSASNKQPWRIIRQGNDWHFYLCRTKGYRENSLTRFLGVADMQKIDMGIAMSHFELTARELGYSGKWFLQDPKVTLLDQQAEYSASWQIINKNTIV